MAVTRTYLSIDGQILSEMRAGETRARDYVLDPLASVMGVYQADWPVAYMSFDSWGKDDPEDGLANQSGRRIGLNPDVWSGQACFDQWAKAIYGLEAW